MAAKNAQIPITQRKITLNNSVELPCLGLGTYRIQKQELILKAIDSALNAGYRLFDTAAVYNNEHHIGQALKHLLPKYGLTREDVFITTKLNPKYHGGNHIREAFLHSLKSLETEYIDLYLIHFPGTPKLSVEDANNSLMRKKTWEALVQIYESGKAKAIGVSNYTVRHLQELMTHNLGVIPTVNQVEWHPYYFQPELHSYCQDIGVALQAYCSFGGHSLNNDSLLNEKIVIEISKKINVSPQQLLLTWALQNNVAIIPKSTNPEHIMSNTKLNFFISDEDMKSLDELGQKHCKYAWDPSKVL